MKKLLFSIALLAISSLIPAHAQDVFVQGYIKRDGTYVQPHYRTRPDGNPWNNYSTYGNINPYTGQRGYKRPSYGYRSRSGGYSLYGGNSRSLYGGLYRNRRRGW